MHLHDTLRPSLVDQHGTADFPLDAPDVSGLLRQSSFFSVRVGRQTTSRSLSSVKIMGPQALLLRDTQSIWVESLRMIIYAASFLTRRRRRRASSANTRYVRLSFSLQMCKSISKFLRFRSRSRSVLSPLTLVRCDDSTILGFYAGCLRALRELPPHA